MKNREFGCPHLKNMPEAIGYESNIGKEVRSVARKMITEKWNEDSINNFVEELAKKHSLQNTPYQEKIKTKLTLNFMIGSFLKSGYLDLTEEDKDHIIEHDVPIGRYSREDLEEIFKELLNAKLKFWLQESNFFQENPWIDNVNLIYWTERATNLGIQDIFGIFETAREKANTNSEIIDKTKSEVAARLINGGEVDGKIKSFESNKAYCRSSILFHQDEEMREHFFRYLKDLVTSNELNNLKNPWAGCPVAVDAKSFLNFLEDFLKFMTVEFFKKRKAFEPTID